MCTLIAKKFADIGWVGVKNRDRSAPTVTRLVRENKGSMEKVTLMDETTHWSEGMNSHSIGVISSSLERTVTESELEKLSKNGQKISQALNGKTVEDVVESLIRSKVNGCVFVFDKDNLYVLEGNPKTKEIMSRKIVRDFAVRTNHGIFLPDAGYQSDSNSTEERMRRISSEARYMIGNTIVDLVDKPEDIMVYMAREYSDNPQLTTLRRSLGLIKTRTTEQLIIEPGKNRMLVRNTDGVLKFNQKNANKPDSQILVGVV